MAKKNHRSSAKGPTPQLRSRTTRSSKPRLLTDPTSTTQLLTTQLQSLGLYAAPTIGDGNCLFRALSDQVHGSPEKHREVRKQVCDWIEQHKERYEGFVEDDDYLVEDGKTGKGGPRDKGKGLEAHLRCMRENATYGGHMELSAFAHLTRRDIKVIQPGLVYVIEWHAGEPPISTNSASVLAPITSSSSTQDQDPHPERRRSKRTQRPPASSPSPLSPSSSSKQSSNPDQDGSKQIVKIGSRKHGYYVYEEITDSEEEEEVEETLKQDCEADKGGESTSERVCGGETVYVAYHDWEHFSSIRNLRGPHAGLPQVRETPAHSVLVQREREKEALKECEREKQREGREKEKEKERKKKERERENKTMMKVKLKLSSSTSSSTQPIPTGSTSLTSLSSLSSLSSCSSLTSIAVATTADPALVPLPTSRSVSPFLSSPTSAIQSRIYPGTPIDPSSTSTSISTTTATSTMSTTTPSTSISKLPTMTIPTISPPIPATPTTPILASINTTTTRSSQSQSHSHLQLHLHLNQHQHRSPKRTFDESSASGEDGDGGSGSGGSVGGVGGGDSGSGREKRSRVGSVVGGGGRGQSRLGSGGDVGNIDVEMDGDGDTPGLSAPGSSSETSLDSSSDLTSPSPPPQPTVDYSLPQTALKLGSQVVTGFSYPAKDASNVKKPLTRRQRKALGLPKPRPSLSYQPPASAVGVGKIIIPGGKWKGRHQSHNAAVSVVDEGDGGTGAGADQEWRRNGAGRVDVRGFRELKI